MAEKLGIHEPTLRAFTVQPIRVGELDIHPAAMGHFMALRRFCPDFDSRPLDGLESVRAVVVFSTPPGSELEALLTISDAEFAILEQKVAARMLLKDAQVLSDAIRYQVDSAVAPAIKTKGDGKKKNSLGWWIEIFEWALATYGWTESEVLKMPVARIMSLCAAYSIRNGGEFSGPDYQEADILDELDCKE